MKACRSNRFRWLIIALTVMALVPSVAWAADSSETTLAAGAIATQDASKIKQNGFTSQKVNMKVPTTAGQTIADGVYIISSANDSQLLIGAAGLKDNARIKLKTQNGTKFQMWFFVYNSVSQSYEISNRLTGKALTTDGSTVYQSAFMGRGSDRKYLKQRWYVTATSKGYRIISAYNTNLSLTVDGKSGSIVKLAAKKSSNTQRFWIFDATNWKKSNVIKNGTYVLKSGDGPFLLESKSASTKYKQIFRVNKKRANDTCQMFDITYIKGGYYKIEDVGTTMALAALGTKVVQSPYRGLKNQLWKPIVKQSGKVIFVNKAKKKVLDIQGGTAAAKKAAKLTTLKGSGTNTQNWIVSPTTTDMTSVVKRAFPRVVKQDSKTNYSIAIDLTAHQLMIFKRNTPKSSWKFDRQWMVSSGANRATLEWIGEKSRFQKENDPSKGYTCYYWSRMGGHQYMHSVIYSPGTMSVSDGRIGYWISNGCVRMSYENAKYIYNMIPTYTCVQRYY